VSKLLQISIVAVSLTAVVALGFFARYVFVGADPESDSRDSPPTSAQIFELDGQKFKRWAVPREVPGLKFSDPIGRPSLLGGFRGRVILLNLWATWCPRCREGMPAVDRLNAHVAGDQFTVVTLALDSPAKAKAEAFLRQIKATTLRGVHAYSGGWA